MQITFPRASHQQRLLAGAVVLALAAGTLSLSVLPAWKQFLLTRPSVCLLKTVTGVPCLACRGTRAAIALTRGKPGLAWHYNPMATLFVTSCGTYLVLVGFAGRSCQFRLSRPETILFWTLLGFALLGNWIYVIRQGG